MRLWDGMVGVLFALCLCAGSANATYDGYAVEFDGVQNQVRLGNGQDFQIGSDFTISMWIYPYDVTGDRVLFSKRSADDSDFEPVFTILIKNGELCAELRSSYGGVGEKYEYKSGYSIAVKKWTHIGFQRQSARTWKWYVNGTMIKSLTKTFAVVTSDAQNLIGCQYYGDTWRAHYSGIIDEVKIWNASGADIDWSINREIIGTDDVDLLGYYRFNRGCGSYATDFSGNYKEAELYSSTITNISAPKWVCSTAPLSKLSSNSHDQNNLIHDGSFENGDAVFSSGYVYITNDVKVSCSDFSYSTQERNTGDRSLLLHDVSNIAMMVVISKSYNFAAFTRMQESGHIIFSAYVKSVSASEDITIEFNNPDDNAPSCIYKNGAVVSTNKLTVGQEWTYLECTFSRLKPISQYWYELFLKSTGSIYIDDVRLYAIDLNSTHNAIFNSLNYFPNWSIENSSTDWNWRCGYNSIVMQEQEKALIGNHSLIVSKCNSGSGASCITTLNNSMSVSTEVVLSTWVNPSDDTDIGIDVFKGPEITADVLHSDLFTVAAGEWQQIHTRFIMLDAEEMENITIRIGSDNIEYFNLDAFCLEKWDGDHEFYGPVISKSFNDGLGKSLQSLTAFGNKSIVSGASYDAVGNPFKKYKVIEVSNVNQQFIPGLEDSVLKYFSAQSMDPDMVTRTDLHDTRPFTETEYEASPLNRVTAVIPAGYAFMEKKVETTYGSDDDIAGDDDDGEWLVHPEGDETTPLEGYFYEQNTVDENDNVATQWTDVYGRVRGKCLDNGGLHLMSLNEFDIMGNLIRSLPPKMVYQQMETSSIESLAAKYRYNTLGQLIKKEVPDMAGQTNSSDDEGKIANASTNMRDNADMQYKYDNNGNILFSQDSEQAELYNGTSQIIAFTTYDYDAFNRLKRLINIEMPKNFEITDKYGNTETPIVHFWSQTTDYLSANELPQIEWYNIINECTDNIPLYNCWDNTPAWKSEHPWDNISAAVIGEQNNLKGRLAAKAYLNPSYADNPNTQYEYGITAYSYDEDGRIEKVVQVLPDKRLEPITITYEYSMQGKVTAVHYNDAYSLYYSYDALGRLSKVGESPGGHEYCSYEYYIDGKIKKITYFDAIGGVAQIVQNKYNIRGWLTSINDVATVNVGGDDNTYFAEDLYYTTGAYGTNSYFNGNIAKTVHALISPTGTNEGYTYQYKYDAVNRLLYADHYGSDAYDVTNDDMTGDIEYDNNGNLISLGRNDETGNMSADYMYRYYPGTNRLMNLTGDNNELHARYAYDKNGNMIIDEDKAIGDKDNSTGAVTPGIQYDYRNMPTKVTIDHPTESEPHAVIQFIYDADGNRINKTTAITEFD